MKHPDGVLYVDPPGEDLGHNAFGFVWGPMRVIRAATFKNNGRALLIEAGRDRLEIYVSEKGRSVRVFKNHKELK